MKGFLKNSEKIISKNSLLTPWEKRILSCAYISNFEFDVEFPSSNFYIFGFTDWAPCILHPINSFNMSFPQLFYLFVGFYLDGRHVFSNTGPLTLLVIYILLAGFYTGMGAMFCIATPNLWQVEAQGVFITYHEPLRADSQSACSL